MVTIRIETISDADSGKVFAEIYRDDESTPIMRSQATFASHEELARSVMDMLTTHFPDHSPVAENPTIGV